MTLTFEAIERRAAVRGWHTHRRDNRIEVYIVTKFGFTSSASWRDDHPEQPGVVLQWFDEEISDTDGKILDYLEGRTEAREGVARIFSCVSLVAALQHGYKTGLNDVTQRRRTFWIPG